MKKSAVGPGGLLHWSGLVRGFGGASAWGEGAHADPSSISSYMKEAPSCGDLLQGWLIPVPGKELGLGKLRHGETKEPDGRVQSGLSVLIPLLKTSEHFIPTEETRTS